MLPGFAYALPPGTFDCLAPAVVFLQEQQRPRIVRGKAVLEADRITFDPEAEVTRLFGNVVATYDEARLTCETATIDQATGEARFVDGVRIVDPIGTLSAREVMLRFGENITGGYAKGIVLDAYEAHFEGEELTIDGDAWRLKNAWFSTCPEHYKVLLTDIVARPGKFIHAKRSGFEFFDKLKVPVPFFRVGLNPKETGLQSPVPSLDEDFALGYRWDNVFAFRSTTISYSQRGKLEDPPSTRMEFSYAIKDNETSILTPRNEDRERFSEGYMDNVTVRSTQQEDRSVGQERLLAFVGRSGNLTTRARPGTPEALDRPFYIGFEAGGHIGNLLANAQIRFGDVMERLSPAANRRTEVTATALLPDVSIADNVSLRFRADLGAVGGDTNYGWIRPMVSLVVRPMRELTVSASYFSATQWGTPLFNADRLYSNEAIHLRADLDFASTDLSVLLKYDADRRKLYDVEFALEQVADCIKPFVSYRKFPGSFAIGFTLRADRLFEALKQRVPNRTPEGG